LLLLPVILVGIACDVVAQTSAWWQPQWAYQLPLTVQNGSGGSAAAAHYAVKAVVNTNQLVSSGQMLASCNDLRAVFFDGANSTELDRVVNSCGSTQTEVWFALQRAIPAGGSDTGYALYYGNAAAGAPPSNGMNVFVFYENWENGVNHWTSAGGLDTANTGTMGTSQISTDEAFSGTHSEEFTVKGSGGDAFSGLIPVTPNTLYAVSVRGISATAAYLPVGFDPYDANQNKGSETWLWTSQWTLSSQWTLQAGTFTTASNTAYLKLKSEWWNEGPGTAPVYLDDVVLRYAMLVEPTVTLGSVQSGLPAPTLTNVGAVTPITLGASTTVSAAVMANDSSAISQVILQVLAPEVAYVSLGLVNGTNVNGIWQTQFTPSLSGSHTYQVVAYSANGTSTASAVQSFTVVPPPPSLSAVSVTPSLVVGGGTATGTVTLSGAAPAGGISVGFSSGSSSATVPSSVTVPAGASTATFLVSTSVVTASTPVSISATYAGSSQSTTLTLQPGDITGLPYRIPITLTNAGPTLTNYQVNISLTSANMNFSHANPDGSDIRVRSSDGVTDIPYWIENWNSVGQIASVWANVPLIPNGSSTIYIVYGDASASTTANGTNTFLFFDDFSTSDASSQYGYYAESALNTVNLGNAQSWENSDWPHFISVLPNTLNIAIDGVTYPYIAWYGLHIADASGIGLMGSNDGVNWIKYSANPVIPLSTGASRPSVILDGSTLRMAYETAAFEPQIGYATSTDGKTWTIQPAFTALPGPASTPHLWQNPNDNNFYLYYSYSTPGNPYVINVREAATVTDLSSAADMTIWNNYPFVGNASYVHPIYAPHITYDSVTSLYALQFESSPSLANISDASWDVTTLLSSSPTSGFYLAAGNPMHSNGYGCPENYLIGSTLYSYYCHYTGSEWQMAYTTSNPSSGLATWANPLSSKWTANPASPSQAPNWYLEACTDWKGAPAKCLYGFNRYAVMPAAPSFLASSYSGTDYILNARVMPVENNFNETAVRMGPTAGNAYTFEYYNTSNIYSVKRTSTGGWTQLDSNAGPTFADGLWYHMKTTVHGTTIAVDINDGTAAASGTDGTYRSGSAGPALDPQASSVYGPIFVVQYTDTVPASSVGGEQSGSY
jgi:hypothetical protein